MSYLTLFYIFFKVGLFTIGGGLASLSLIQDYIVNSGYIRPEEFYDIVAVAQSAPGPVGANMAAYIGFNFLGIPGAALAVFAIVLAPFIIIAILAYTLKRVDDNKYVIAAFSGFRPAAIGLIMSVTYMLLKDSVLEIGSGISLDSDLMLRIVLCIATVILSLKFRIHPLFCIIGGGIIGGFLL